MEGKTQEPMTKSGPLTPTASSYITKSEGKTKPNYLGDAKSEKLQVAARSSYKKELMKIVKHNIKVLLKAVKSYRSYNQSDIIAKLSRS